MINLIYDLCSKQIKKKIKILYHGKKDSNTRSYLFKLKKKKIILQWRTNQYFSLAVVLTPNSNYILYIHKTYVGKFIYQPILSSRPFRTYFLYKIFYNKRGKIFPHPSSLSQVFSPFTFSLYYFVVLVQLIVLGVGVYKK